MPWLINLIPDADVLCALERPVSELAACDPDR